MNSNQNFRLEIFLLQAVQGTPRLLLFAMKPVPVVQRICGIFPTMIVRCIVFSIQIPLEHVDVAREYENERKPIICVELQQPCT